MEEGDSTKSSAVEILRILGCSNEPNAHRGGVGMELREQIVISKDPKHKGRELERKIRDRSAKLGVIGLGYAGLHLALEMAHNGFQVTGIDIDGSKVESINGGISYVMDVQHETLSSAVVGGSIRATQSFASVEFLDAISICVPTPLTKTKDPDLSYMMAAVEAVHNHLKPGKLIILESTISPGTTQDIVLPILQKSGLKVGRDFFLAYSPKRVRPGNKTFTTRNIPKVIGGMTPRCMTLAALLYHQFIERIIPVTSPEAAEMVKLVEDTFRSVNFALANEMASVCLKFGVNVWEVIEAAKSKPFDFMPFYPGPGMPGYCTAVEPSYLPGEPRVNGSKPLLVEIAGMVNSQLPGFTSSRISDALNKRKKSINGSHILALGIAHTRDSNDLRESAPLGILKSLHEKGAIVSYSDPHVPSIELDGKTLTSTSVTPDILSSADWVVILTDHSVFDYPTIVAHSRLVLDCRNALRKYSAENVVTV
jgi:UDP-N-acetyl-D-glucosamine dehydrogenase